jgi:DNA-binding IclR family transcriptional regulator
MKPADLPRQVADDIDHDHLTSILPAVKGTGPAGGVQVIARAAQMLRALEGEPRGLSLAQIAERVGLPRSTVHRIVTALAAEGLLASVSSTGRVRIGPEFARPAAAGPAELWRPVEPFMQRLHDQLGETIDCGMLDGSQVRVIHVIPTTRYMLRAIAEVGQSFPLYCTAKGKALLAALDRPVALRKLPSTLHSYTPHTLTSVAAIEADLAKVAETGVAYDREEATLGICAVGIAVREPSGVLLTVSVVVPAQRYPAAEPAITAALREIRSDAFDAFSPLRIRRLAVAQSVDAHVAAIARAAPALDAENHRCRMAGGNGEVQ